MLGKKLINSGPISSGANTFASENFNTVLYTGTGASQRIGGYINKSAIFNGSSSYITIPINKLTNTFSLSVWLFADDLSTSYRWVFGNWNSTSQDIYIMVNSSGTIEVNPDGNNGTTIFGSSGTFTANTWHHLAVVFDGTGDCLTVSDNADFEFGSGNFTIEAFIYYTGSVGNGSNSYVICSKWDNQAAPNDKGYIFRVDDDGSGANLQWFYTTDGSANQTTAPSVILVRFDLPLTPDGVSGRISGSVDAGMKSLVYFATPL